MPGTCDKWDTELFEDIDMSQRTVWCNTMVHAKTVGVRSNSQGARSTCLRKNSDLPNLDPEGRFRKIAEMRHKCRMAAI